MKKPITIPKIEEDLYNSIKAKADENNQSVSDYVSSIFEKSLNPETNEDLDTQSEKIKTLQEELEKVKTENNSLHQENYDLTEKVKEKDSKIKSLTEDCGKFDEQRAELKAQIQELQENQSKSDNPNSVTLQFEEFDFAVLKYCLEKFNEETDKNFNEAELLKYMFTEYAVKGSIYFFTTPGYFRLKEIKKQVEEQKQNLNNE